MTTELPYFQLEPGKDYRWCNPDGERWEVLQERGWQPCLFNGKQLRDKELILCIKQRPTKETTE